MASAKKSDKKGYGAVETEEPDVEKGETPFTYSINGLTSAEADELLAVHGPNCLPENKVPAWYIFLELLWQPMPIMIWIAAIIEAAIGNYLDMGILLFIQFANASIAFYETMKAGDAVEALKASLKPEATVKRDGKVQKIDATLLVPGDLVILGAGSAIPADCRVNPGDGSIEVDQAQLTGESLPVTRYGGASGEDGNVLMGSTVVRGEMDGTVEFTGANTFFGKTAALLAVSLLIANLFLPTYNFITSQQTAPETSNLQDILIDIMIVLVLLSLTMCSIVFVYLIQTTDVVEGTKREK